MASAPSGRDAKASSGGEEAVDRLTQLPPRQRSASPNPRDLYPSPRGEALNDPGGGGGNWSPISLRNSMGIANPSSSPMMNAVRARRKHSSNSHGSSGGGASPRMVPKSNSLTSINSSNSGDCADGGGLLDQDDIIHLTHQVHTFSDILSKLKAIFPPPEETQTESPRVAAHELLRQLLLLLKNLLNRYPALHSPDIHTSAIFLISQIKGLGNEAEETREADHRGYYEAVDQLALAFSSSVSEYLMGDLDQSLCPFPSFGHSKSLDNLSSASVSGSSEGSRELITDMRDQGPVSPQEVDSALFHLESGVDLALERARLWSKYTKDVISYVEKRVHLEAEFSKNLAKLAKNMKPQLSAEGFLPLKSVYCSALDQDVEYAANCEATYGQIQAGKFIEPLMARRNEHDRQRKKIKDTWLRAKKEMVENKVNLDKARQQYLSRQQEYQKAKEQSIRLENESGLISGALGSPGGVGLVTGAKIDKKRRAEEEALHKAVDAETLYKACIVEANEEHKRLEDTKHDLLVQLRELICQCDRTLKTATLTYFQMQYALSVPSPVQFQSLCEQSRAYEPGAEFTEYVRHQPHTAAIRINGASQPFTFEPYVPGTATLWSQQRKHSSQSSSSGDLHSSSSIDDNSPRTGSKDKLRMPPLQAWGLQAGSSDTESVSGSSTRSQDMDGGAASPAASPHDTKRKLAGAPNGRGRLEQSYSSGDELGDGEGGRDQNSNTAIQLDTRFLPQGGSSPGSKYANLNLSKSAKTHTLRKLRTPSKCRECDSYVYFNGAECERCGLASHKKCLESLAIQCGGRRLQRRMNVFGVPLRDHLQETARETPFIVSKCISEIDRRALTAKGIFRVAGVKAKVEKLCQTFENGADLVDITETPPHLISSALKLYFRQLPQPLLTYDLYAEFIAAARDSLEEGCELDNDEVIAKLKEIVSKLPEENLKTTAQLMQHLKRISEHSQTNLMPASNLGIVFGPTLLRPSEALASSLSSLEDMPYRTRAIELLIHNAQVFGTPIEDLQPSASNYDFLERSSPTEDKPVGSGLASPRVPTPLVSEESEESGGPTPGFTLPGGTSESASPQSEKKSHDSPLLTKQGNVEVASDSEDHDHDHPVGDMSGGSLLLPDDSARTPEKAKYIRKVSVDNSSRGGGSSSKREEAGGDAAPAIAITTPPHSLQSPPVKPALMAKPYVPSSMLGASPTRAVGVQGSPSTLPGRGQGSAAGCRPQQPLARTRSSVDEPLHQGAPAAASPPPSEGRHAHPRLVRSASNEPTKKSGGGGGGVEDAEAGAGRARERNREPRFV